MSDDCFATWPGSNVGHVEVRRSSQFGNWLHHFGVALPNLLNLCFPAPAHARWPSLGITLQGFAFCYVEVTEIENASCAVMRITTSRSTAAFVGHPIPRRVLPLAALTAALASKTRGVGRATLPNCSDVITDATEGKKTNWVREIGVRDKSSLRREWQAMRSLDAQWQP